MIPRYTNQDTQLSINTGSQMENEKLNSLKNVSTQFQLNKTKKQKKFRPKLEPQGQTKEGNIENEFSRFSAIMNQVVLIPQQRVRVVLGGQQPQILLFGDIIIDMNSISLYSSSYNPIFPKGVISYIRIMKLHKEKLVIFFTQSNLEQIIDFRDIISAFFSMSTMESQEFAQMLSYHQQQTQLILSSLFHAKSVPHILSIPLMQNPEDILQKSILIVKKQVEQANCKFYTFNLYLIDPERNRLNRYLVCSNSAWVNVIGEDENITISQHLKGQVNQIYWRLYDFLIVQIPFIQSNRIIKDIFIRTIDHYILSVEIEITNHKFTEYSHDLIQLLQYKIDPTLISELIRVRRLRQKIKYQKQVSELLENVDLKKSIDGATGSETQSHLYQSQLNKLDEETKCFEQPIIPTFLKQLNFQTQ